jgi:hypothetical protein
MFRIHPPEAPGFAHEIPMYLENSTKLVNLTRPYETPDSSSLDYIMLSDGVNKTVAAIDYEKDDPSDIALGVACWTEATGSLVASDLVGDWVIQFWADPNLRDTTFGFELSTNTGPVTAEGSDVVVLLMSGSEVRLRISGMEATLIDAPVTTAGSVIHAIKIASNGLGISMYMVVTEIDDPTDVSVSLGLGTRK